MRSIFSFFTLFLILSNTNADNIRLASYFQSNMVLQQGKPVTVWGTAPVDKKIEVVFDGETISSVADKKGEWSVTFNARKASFEPKELLVGDVVLHNILIGDVWICSGQSNMVMKISACDDETRDIGKQNCGNIRLLDYSGIRIVANNGYTEKELLRCNVNDYFQYTWKEASYETFQDFSAVATHFGIKIQEEINTPIGLICCAVGGSAINNWIPERILKKHTLTRSLFESDWLSNEDIIVNHRKRCLNAFKNVLLPNTDYIPGKFPYRFITEPGFAYEASLGKLSKIGVRGILWYQGEADSYSEKSIMKYETLFKMLVGGWRANFHDKKIPFVVIQLPQYKSPHWQKMRDLQEKLCRQVPDVYMVGTRDLGDEHEIHYKNKKIVGERAASVALSNVYK